MNLILTTLNVFHNKIKFSVEIEKDSASSQNTKQNTHNSILWKPNSDFYIHWNSFGSNKWKLGTIKSLLHKAYDNWSTDQYLEMRLKTYIQVSEKLMGFHIVQ